MDSTAVSQALPRRIVEVHRQQLGRDQSGSQTLAKGLTLLELVADRQGGYGVSLADLLVSVSAPDEAIAFPWWMIFPALVVVSFGSLFAVQPLIDLAQHAASALPL